NGNYYYGNWNPPATGTYTLRATPYSGANGTGTPGAPRTISFTFTSTGIAANLVNTLQAIEGVESEGLLVYPNPFSDKANINFTLLQNGEYTLNLYDSKGALVKVLKQGRAEAGVRNAVEINGSRLAKGLYLIRLQTDSGAITTRLIVER
ncbi:T9SS type A sorting domain-containing protein, partial [Pontibacter sp. HSC-36F09]|uniref:T9SS type A sorting domain-containing protein n=1 Tax=Pontibacter sp. HSC-36F09 TaxID=2910966 RepID=UPI00209DE021